MLSCDQFLNPNIPSGVEVKLHLSGVNSKPGPLGPDLYLTDSPDGGFRITSLNEEFANQFNQAERIMHDDRDALRELAKR